jgi:hypothetical protein
MDGVPETALRLLEAQHLGEIWRVYRPRTRFRLVSAILVLALASGWVVGAFLGAFSPPVPPVAVRVFYPLVGLGLAGWGLYLFVRAVRLKDVRAVLCEYGAVQLGLQGAHAFRFDQVASVLPRADSGLGVQTIICQDGRRFVLDRALADVDDLGRRIRVSVAGVHGSSVSGASV